MFIVSSFATATASQMAGRAAPWVRASRQVERLRLGLGAGRAVARFSAWTTTGRPVLATSLEGPQLVGLVGQGEAVELVVAARRGRGGEDLEGDDARGGERVDGRPRSASPGAA